MYKMDLDFDYIVVGAGINGSWTAYHLANNGHKTLLVEQFPLPHSRGSSHGQSRIIRVAYPQPELRAMATKAYDFWEHLENFANKKILEPSGLLWFGPTSDPSLREVISTAPKGTYQVYDNADQLNEAFPQLRSDAGFQGCYDAKAGVLRADLALAATRDLAKSVGCLVKDSFKVTDIVPSDDDSLVTIHGHKGDSLTAKAVVITAGPWAKRVLSPLGLDLPLETHKISVCYFKQTGDPLPCSFIINDPQAGNVYGLPEMEYPGLVKVCLHRGLIRDPDCRDQNSGAEEGPFMDDLKAFVAKRLPGLDPDPALVEACMYTMTPDEVQVLDLHPDHRNIIIGAGFSGSGFKIGPVTGQILADLAMKGEHSGFDLQQFAVDRF